MKLEKIKAKLGNKSYTESIYKTIESIKSAVELNDNYPFYLLCWYKFGQIYLHNGTIYAIRTELEPNENLKPVELYSITLTKNYPKKSSDIDFKTIINTNKISFISSDSFLQWIDEPSEINEEIDMPYYEVIKFLNNYSKETFRTERYLFYSKWDNDPSFITNIYAYDTRNQAEIKLYIPKEFNGGKCQVPQNLLDIIVDDLSGKLSGYQKRQCKKEFLTLANQYNQEYGVKNYWLMELAKLTIQPIDELHEWSCHRVFSGQENSNIWVYDCPKLEEEPSFFVTDSPFLQETTKVAVLNFKTPTYNTKTIYKRGNVKRKAWELDKQDIDNLLVFLNAPYDKDIEGNQLSYDKYVKTNWQQLIFEYNHNTAGWGWGETKFDIPPEKDLDRLSNLEALSFDLPIPDYTKLLNDKW